ncbi:MAG: MFS transporter [Balneolales bacterium]|nr:MFS transporter [Balneolales bacterium]
MNDSKSKATAEQVYTFLTEDDDNACEAIPDSACHEAPGNFLLNAGNGASTKLAEQLASPGLVLPWILSAVGAPAAFSGLLVPVQKAGSLLPQLAVSSKIRAYPVRKHFWTAAGTLQGVSLSLMALAVLFLEGVAAGITIVTLLAIFSMASGIGSVSFKDVVAKTIPKGKRGTLLSVRATAGALLTLIAGTYLHLYGGDDEALIFYFYLLAGAAFLWFLAALLFHVIKETEGATDGARNAIQEAKEGYLIVKKVPGFARFVLARALMLGLMLIIPFYVIFGRDILGEDIGSLGVFILANALAGLLSSYFWGRFSDKSSRKVMIWGAAVGLVSVFWVLCFPLLPDYTQNVYVFSAAFFIAGFGQTGIRLGRKTYLLDAAPEKERPLYVAVSNTLIGTVILASVLISVSSAFLGVWWIIAIFGSLIAAGIIAALYMPEAGNMLST